MLVAHTKEYPQDQTKNERWKLLQNIIHKRKVQLR